MMGIPPVWLAFGTGLILGAFVTVGVMALLAGGDIDDDDFPSGPPRLPR